MNTTVYNDFGQVSKEEFVEDSEMVDDTVYGYKMEEYINMNQFQQTQNSFAQKSMHNESQSDFPKLATS